MRGAKKFLAWMAALSLVTGFTFSGNTLYAATNSDWEDVSDDDWEDADDDWEDADAPELNVDSARIKSSKNCNLEQKTGGSLTTTPRLKYLV